MRCFILLIIWYEQKETRDGEKQEEGFQGFERFIPLYMSNSATCLTKQRDFHDKGIIYVISVLKK